MKETEQNFASVRSLTFVNTAYLTPGKYTVVIPY